MMQICSYNACQNTAKSQLRLIPRRVDEPIAAEIRQALAWPDTELATTVFSCPFHREAIRKAARCVMVETPLGDEEVVFRAVKDTP